MISQAGLAADLASIHDEADPPEAALDAPVHNEKLEEVCNRLVAHIPRENSPGHDKARKQMNLDLEYIKVNPSAI